MHSADELNREYSIGRTLRFREGPGGFVFASVNNEAASAEICLHGAQVISFVPEDFDPVIYLSPASLYEPGKAIRGGIPVSWPWFADHPTDDQKPAHGFARTSAWTVISTDTVSDEETEIVFELSDSRETLKLWEHEFDLRLAVRVGNTLSLELVTTNNGDEPFSITSAFHSYYHVSDVGTVRIKGLGGLDYIDKVAEYEKKRQPQELSIRGETDRIYLNTSGDCVIEDEGLGRAIIISKTGSESTVVWNPWREKAAGMSDLPDDGYLNFVCVETANAGEDVIQVPPGGGHTLGAMIQVNRL